MSKSKKIIKKEQMYSILMPTGETRHSVAPNIKLAKPYSDAAEKDEAEQKKAEEEARKLKARSEEEKKIDEYADKLSTKIEAKKEIDPIEEADKILKEDKGEKAEDTPMKKQVETIMVNIREKMVLEKLDEALEKFKCCTCFFCKQDVTTMALNSLKPKYIITTEVDIDKIIKNENYEEVTQAIMKAILHVKTHPRH